jgi:hypothetical protein
MTTIDEDQDEDIRVRLHQQLVAGQALLTDAAASVGGGNLADALLDLKMADTSVCDSTKTLVVLMRVRGYTWQQIGAVFGVTRQSAQEHFSEAS